MLTVDELHHRDLIKSYRLEAFYRKILNECYEFIETIYDLHNKNETVFCIPYTNIKEEDYDFTACLIYVIKELRNSGFYVRYLKPNMLYISWINEDKQKERIENLKKLFMENEMTKKSLGKKVKTIEYTTKFK